MTRLNKELREGIVNNAIKSAGITAREESLRARNIHLAEACRISAAGGFHAFKKTRECYDKVNALLKDLGRVAQYHRIGTAGLMYCYFGGLRGMMRFNGCEDATRDRVSKEVLGEEPRFSAKDPITLEFHAIEKERGKIRALRETLVAEVGAAVGSVGTVEKLIALWPESEALIPKIAAGRGGLPAVRVEQLNAIVGLPKDK